jgi:hypothetical protein
VLRHTIFGSCPSKFGTTHLGRFIEHIDGGDPHGVQFGHPIRSLAEESSFFYLNVSLGFLLDSGSLDYK